jgi:GalNAc-alpha-(1->4)-GalNAc-alpha-(1->3)-diNAcBac-PP-undecaprenol alpha-1,4-N-acetyl-D-galactosaminyltransferase
MGRRLTLVVPSLALGGAERVVANMANHWAAHDDTVSVITLSAADTDTYFLDPAVSRVALDLMRDSRFVLQGIYHNWLRVGRVEDAIRKLRPDTVISFTDRMNVVTLAACRNLKVDTVVAERIDPSQQPIGYYWSKLRRWGYPMARALVVQTQLVRSQLTPMMRGRPIYVIPNYIDAPAPELSRKSRSNTSDELQLAAMGRLDHQKGFDLLIDAFAKVAEEQPNWSLVILGEGPERRRLEEQIHSYGLERRVRLLGWISDPSTVLRDSDAFVLSSRYEGFPNALLEAMALGLPAISVDCPSGPADIIRQEVDGLLVPLGDVPALAATLRRLLADERLRHRLGAEAVRVVERFSSEHYFARWDAVLRKDSPESVARRH